MTLFKITLNNVKYDDYDGAIVVANCEDEVEILCKDGNDIRSDGYVIGRRFEGGNFRVRVYQNYIIERIGTTKKYKVPTIILSSFNAG